MQRTISEISHNLAVIDDAVPEQDQIKALQAHKSWLMAKLLSPGPLKMPRDRLLYLIKLDDKKLFFRGVGKYPCPKRYNPYRLKEETEG